MSPSELRLVMCVSPSSHLLRCGGVRIPVVPVCIYIYISGIAMFIGAQDKLPKWQPLTENKHVYKIAFY